MGWDGQEIIVLTPDMIEPDSDSNQIHLLTAGNVLSRSFPQAAAGGCRNGTDTQTHRHTLPFKIGKYNDVQTWQMSQAGKFFG